MLNLTNTSLDNYEIIKEIGKGSFSIVYLVKKYSSQKEFALKKVNIVKLTSKERQNSLKEVNFLSEIKDPNVIGYEESFYDNDFSHLYLVMEYAPYGDLGKILQKRKKLKEYFTENDLLNIYLQISSGLKAIHAKQIIHRDLKSANIFITQYDDLVLKIGDFNVSKKIDYLNLKNTQTGTPYYASPEIWENRPYDFKSDIWSLGCLFYEIASFSTPFRGNNMKELYQNILKGNMAPLPKQYSNNISKIIKMCLRQDANLRPNINDIKFYIENLKLEQHFKKVFDENYLDINNYSNHLNNNFGIKRQTSYYIKQSKNLILDNFYNAYPEFDNLNLKLRNELTPIKQSQNNNSNNLAKNKTRIKLAGLLNMNLNLINNNINNNNIIKENKNNYVYKTDNNLIIKNQQENENKYFNIKLKPPPFKRLL
jgi:NIMA (never in mitosis gene a)-related kinase